MDDVFTPFTPDAWFLGNAARQKLWQFPLLPDDLVHVLIAYRQQLEADQITALTDHSRKAALHSAFHHLGMLSGAASDARVVDQQLGNVRVQRR